MPLFLIRVKSGQQAGRYVGPNRTGLATNPELLKNPEVKVSGTKFSLYLQEQAAQQFFEHAAPDIQGELKKQGYETELLEARSTGT